MFCEDHTCLQETPSFLVMFFLNFVPVSDILIQHIAEDGRMSETKKNITRNDGFSCKQGECMAALGMEEGRIPDTAISASSSYEIKSVGPQNARFLGDMKSIAVLIKV
ncbi:hypothetical protein O3M35_002637 [Rhynocoris fuscipes]|uniref:Uncharacterized protein n=1 Tax=Rhynocoris fuscipes TaxID=488301 RepID=A0AAW1CM32_9HEMI